MELLAEPLQVSLVIGVNGGIRPNARNVSFMADQPRRAGGRNAWQVIGISRDQWRLIGAALALGGQRARGGRGRLLPAKRRHGPFNGDLNCRVRQMAEDISSRPATVAEAPSCWAWHAAWSVGRSRVHELYQATSSNSDRDDLPRPHGHPGRAAAFRRPRRPSAASARRRPIPSSSSWPRRRRHMLWFLDFSPSGADPSDLLRGRGGRRDGRAPLRPRRAATRRRV